MDLCTGPRVVATALRGFAPLTLPHPLLIPVVRNKPGDFPAACCTQDMRACSDTMEPGDLRAEGGWLDLNSLPCKLSC